MVEHGRCRVVGLAGAVALGVFVASGSPARAQGADAAALRIVVLVGDGATNVLRQKIFVAPIVEVRDAADRPVAGVPVRFVVRGGRGAFLNGQTALTITTTAEGRAAVPGYEPTTAGPLYLDVTASARGRTASVTITQTTVTSVGRASAAPARSRGATAGTAAARGLRIVVIAGEDAVNVVQQQTAVAPIVEVRDRNDQPVAGALVRFAIRSGPGATFGGESAVTVTTNTAGRAAVASFAPTSTGAVQIEVSAAFQGQVATATISQTTVATAAEAATAGSASTSSSGAGSGAGSSAGGGAGGVGGGAAAGAAVGAGTAAGAGMSATTIGLIGAGAVAGTVGIAAAARGGGDEGGAGGGGAARTLDVSTSFSLPVRQAWTYTGSLAGESCSIQYATTGTARMVLQIQASGAASGQFTTTASTTTSSFVCSNAGLIQFPVDTTDFPVNAVNSTVSGSAGSLSAREPGTESFSDPGIGTISNSWTTSFAGAISGNTVTGTLTFSLQCTWPGFVASCDATGATPLTLR